MMKRRKKRVSIIVNGRLNRRAKTRVRDIADDLWGWAVREDWAHKCAICGKPGDQPHHLIPRQFYRTRYELRNGICLCYTHHDSNPALSPHKNAAGWLAWLWKHHCQLAAWYVLNDSRKQRPFEKQLTIDHYCDVIQSLQDKVSPEDFERIVGVKFNRWLKDQS